MHQDATICSRGTSILPVLPPLAFFPSNLPAMIPLTLSPHFRSPFPPHLTVTVTFSSKEPPPALPPGKGAGEEGKEGGKVV
jgi:hypothetical protein